MRCVLAADLQTLIEEAQRNDVEFIYAISPGLDMVYSSAAEQDKLQVRVPGRGPRRAGVAARGGAEGAACMQANGALRHCFRSL